VALNNFSKGVNKTALLDVSIIAPQADGNGV
jgi:hypothetical protein